MFVDTSRGPFCQSCGMPLGRARDFGTAADGHRINDYCHHCYRAGRFTEPDLTVQQMIDQCVAFTVRQTFTPESDARVTMQEAIPRLKRWRD
jgi:hypothetical protein